MKIGYPCKNLSLGCSTSNTFRIRNYSKENLVKKIEQNLQCLKDILEYNVKNNLLFFRLSSDLIPFASHNICSYDWIKNFKTEFKFIGDYIKKFNFRISIHPDQFVVLNSKNEKVIKNSIKELIYHAKILSLMELDNTAKIQIHLGGVYAEKEKSILRFIKTYDNLPKQVKNRLVIENDDRNYNLEDCIKVYSFIGIPIVFDVFHHRINCSQESVSKAIIKCGKTWSKEDGLLMVDYSSQKKNARIGSHIEHIDIEDFKIFLQQTKKYNFDIMFEIKDKEKSALEAIKYLYKDERFFVIKK